MIVMKFGGSSVESAEAIRRVAAIVRERSERPLAVVASAMGKTTDQLLNIARLAAAGDVRSAIKEQTKLRQFHWMETSRLARGSRGIALDHQLCGLFDELAEVVLEVAEAKTLSPAHSDAVLSFGERISSLIVTEGFLQNGIDAVHLDARTVIVTDANHTNAAVQFVETNALLRRKVSRERVTVMGGFIAATQFGAPTTLGRGGSDYTAAIVGAALAADEIQIWTDVDGMLTADPTILPGGHRVKTISFAEAAELAYFGAKVLHPSTVIPAIERNIPVLILNSRHPGVDGTRIVSESVHCTNVVKSIACKRRITLVSIHSTRMLMAHGFLRRIFEIFDRHATSVDMVATSEVSVSLTIDDTSQTEQICKELSEFSEVMMEPEQAIVCLVGENIRYTPGVAARVFDSLRDLNIRMISQGASLLNLSLVVAEKDLRRVVESLHTEFFSELDPLVFEK